jgi:hypothetical protein
VARRKAAASSHAGRATFGCRHSLCTNFLFYVFTFTLSLVLIRFRDYSNPISVRLIRGSISQSSNEDRSLVYKSVAMPFLWHLLLTSRTNHVVSQQLLQFGFLYFLLFSHFHLFHFLFFVFLYFVSYIPPASVPILHNICYTTEEMLPIIMLGYVSMVPCNLRC